MKVIILCGGEGTRMKEETEFKPKPLVEIGGKPILWHIMKIYSHYGYNEFVLTLGYKGSMIKDYFLNWRNFNSDFTLDTSTHKTVFHNNECDNFKITFAETGLNSLTGERVRQIKKYISDDENFMVTYGDGVANIDINQLVNFHKKQNTIGTITGVKPSTRFGFLDVDLRSNKLVGFLQHKVTTSSDTEGIKDTINGGFMVFKREALDLIEPSTMIESIFPVLAKKNQLSVYNHKGEWKCMDTYKEVEEMNDLWMKNPFWKIWK
jgi:glucose-1-phosphate cytidylyltransferase